MLWALSIYIISIETAEMERMVKEKPIKEKSMGTIVVNWKLVERARKMALYIMMRDQKSQ